MQLTDDQIRQISEHVQPHDLPGDLPEIAELLGTYKALLLAHHIGFGRFYLRRWSDAPERWTRPVQIMVNTIGVDDAKHISKNFNGTHIDVPKCDSFWIAWRNKIINLSASTQLEIGLTHNLSDRHVRRIQKGSKINDNQQDLF